MLNSTNTVGLTSISYMYAIVQKKDTSENTQNGVILT